MFNLSNIENIVSRNKLFWKAFFWVFAIAEIKILYGLNAMHGYVINSLQLAIWVFTILKLIALFGFAYEKVILTPLFWKVLFYIIAICSIIFYFIGFTQFSFPINPGDIFLLSLTILDGPALLTFFLYAFRYLPSRVKAHEQSGQYTFRLSNIKIIIPKNKLFWKMFFWLWVIAEIWYLSVYNLINTKLGYLIVFHLWDFVSLTFGVLSLVALFGFAYEKVILTPLFWKVLFYIAIAVSFYDIYLVWSNLLIMFPLNIELISTIMIYIFGGLLKLIPFYHYAFRYLPSRVAANKHS